MSSLFRLRLTLHEKDGRRLCGFFYPPSESFLASAPLESTRTQDHVSPNLICHLLLVLLIMYMYPF